MSAPGYSIIRPKRNVTNVNQIDNDSKLCPIGDAESICKKISAIYENISWHEEICATGKRMIGKIETTKNRFIVSFEVEAIYVGEIKPKWINVDAEGALDVAKEVKQLAEALGCVGLSWRTLTFL
jgi:hypothetical protein